MSAATKSKKSENEPAPSPSDAKCPPWLTSYWEQLFYRHEQKQMPHALLLAGIQGMGKKDFSLFVAAALICQEPSVKGACGKCSACTQLSAHAHADYKYISSEQDKDVIKVDGIRELVDWLHLTANGASYRVALVNQADQLNIASANALLKTLEEPGDGAVLILVSDKPGSLPATILSRCQRITLTNQNSEASVAWLAKQGIAEPEVALKAASGAPYRVIQQQQGEWAEEQKLLTKAWVDLICQRVSVGKIVDSLKHFPVSRCLAHFSQLTVLATSHVQGGVIGADPATQQAVLKTVDSLQSEQWFTIYDRLQQLSRSDSTSFKTEAVLSGLLADVRLMIKG